MIQDHRSTSREKKHRNRSERIWTKLTKSVLVDFGAFGSEDSWKSLYNGFGQNCPNLFWWILVISDRRLTSKQEVHGTRSERIWTKLSKSVLMYFGDFGSHIGIKSASSRKSLRTDLDEIVQIHSGGLGCFRIAD